MNLYGLLSYKRFISKLYGSSLAYFLHCLFGFRYECDYTIFFRELSKVSKQVSTSDEAVEIVSSSFYEQYKVNFDNIRSSDIHNNCRNRMLKKEQVI